MIIGSNHDVGSTAPCPCTEDIAVARFSLTGTAGGVDFGNKTGAQGTVDLGGTEDVTAGIVLANSSIIAVGSKDAHFMIAQLSPGGSLDTGFAAPVGFERLILETASHADAVVADRSERIVVAGTFTMNAKTNLVIVRYLANGGHDTGFGTAGQVVVIGAANETSVAIRALGDKLVLASRAVDGATATFRVRRFLADGAIDPTFGTAGVAEVPASAGDVLQDMIVLSDGSVLVLADSSGKALLLRFTRTGVLDTLFGPNATGAATIFIGDAGAPRTISAYSDHLVVLGGGNQGGTPGPGTFGIVARLWM